ncbi:MAG: amino acid permease [Acidobacteria bacterium]|nr:amino acid permease [Acidobacteriota bacterium]
MATQTKPAELIRGLGAAATTAMVVGNIIGTGVFTVPSNMARVTGSVGLVFVVWIVGGILSLFGALAVAELGAALPEAGGSYVYLKRAFGPKWGFLFGWMNNIVGKPCSIGTIAAGLLIFVSFVIPDAAAKLFTLHIPLPFAAEPYEFVFTMAQPLAACAIIAVTFINYLGVRLAGGVQVVLTSLKVGAILAIVAFGFILSQGSGDVRPAFPEVFGSSAVSGFLIALVAALWGYDGWVDITMAASEVKEPGRNLPRAIVGGTILVGVVYLLANWVYFHVLTFDQVISARNVASNAVEVFAGKNAAIWVTVAMMISALGTLNSSILTGGRVPYAMARDGLFFRVADGIHPQYHTPARGLVFQGFMASAMVLTGQFEDLFTLFIFAQWIFYALTVAAVIQLRRKEPNLPRPYKSWGYPVVPVIFILGATALTVNLFYQKPGRSTIGLILMLSGLFFYNHWQIQSSKQISAA